MLLLYGLHGVSAGNLLVFMLLVYCGPDGDEPHLATLA
jgi:hypothetical protein